MTPSFFSTLQRQPFLGRAFGEDRVRPGADTFAVITFALWTSRFAADRSIVGRDIRLNGEPHTVAGVLPADFELPARDISVLVHRDRPGAARRAGRPGGVPAARGAAHYFARARRYWKTCTREFPWSAT